MTWGRTDLTFLGDSNILTLLVRSLAAKSGEGLARALTGGLMPRRAASAPGALQLLVLTSVAISVPTEIHPFQRELVSVLAELPNDESRAYLQLCLLLQCCAQPAVCAVLRRGQPGVACVALFSLIAAFSFAAALRKSARLPSCSLLPTRCGPPRSPRHARSARPCGEISRNAQPSEGRLSHPHCVQTGALDASAGEPRPSRRRRSRGEEPLRQRRPLDLPQVPWPPRLHLQLQLQPDVCAHRYLQPANVRRAEIEGASARTGAVLAVLRALRQSSNTAWRETVLRCGHRPRSLLFARVFTRSSSALRPPRCSHRPPLRRTATGAGRRWRSAPTGARASASAPWPRSSRHAASACRRRQDPSDPYAVCRRGGRLRQQPFAVARLRDCRAPRGPASGLCVARAVLTGSARSLARGRRPPQVVLDDDSPMVITEVDAASVVVARQESPLSLADLPRPVVAAVLAQLETVRPAAAETLADVEPALLLDRQCEVRSCLCTVRHAVIARCRCAPRCSARRPWRACSPPR